MIDHATKLRELDPDNLYGSDWDIILAAADGIETSQAKIDRLLDLIQGLQLQLQRQRRMT
jgi:hypothetical protein